MEWTDIDKKEDIFYLCEDSPTASSADESDSEVKEQLLVKEEVTDEVEELFSQRSSIGRGRTCFEIGSGKSFHIRRAEVPMKTEPLPLLGVHLLPLGDCFSHGGMINETDYLNVLRMVPLSNHVLTPVTAAANIPLDGSYRENTYFRLPSGEVRHENQLLQTWMEEKSFFKEEEEFIGENSSCLQSAGENACEDDACFSHEEFIEEDRYVTPTDEKSCEEDDPLQYDQAEEYLKEACTESDRNRELRSGYFSARKNCGKLVSVSEFNQNKEITGIKNSRKPKSLLLPSKVCSKASSQQGLQRLENTCRSHEVGGKSFLCNRNLDRRTRLVHKCICEICCKVFSHKAYLAKHMVVHNGIRAFKCEICGKAFTRKRQLQDHALIHQNIRAFKCEVCGRFFTHKRQLKDHVLIHQNIRAFKCEVCGNAFTRKRQLKDHVLIHQNIRAFRCEVCGKAFITKGALSTHSFIHRNIRDFKCAICEKAFNVKSGLKKHMIIHRNIRPFKCEICDKTFVYKQVLNRHLAIHNRVRGFNCEFCDKIFIRNADLKRHAC